MKVKFDLTVFSLISVRQSRIKFNYMNSSKAEQSFSSYSQENNNEPHPSEEDKFSEYEDNQENSVPAKQATKESSNLLREKRRYSYGKIEQRSTAYNYLDAFNQVSKTRPTHYTSQIKNLKQCKYAKGVSSPCGVGTFDSQALADYEKCFLSGLSKYYKGHNYNNLSKKRESHSFSVSSSTDKHEKSLDRSQYWNGQKFQYLAAKELQSKNKQIQSKPQNHQQKLINIERYTQLQRNIASGLIVNKKQIRQSKVNEAKQIERKTQKTSSYIRIEQYPSNSKNYSELKREKIPAQTLQITREPLLECNTKANTQKIERNKENDLKFESIQVKSKQLILMEKQYSSLLAEKTLLLTEKNKLIRQNAELNDIITQKDSQIQRISRERIADNEEYTDKIQKLKLLFQNERKLMVQDFEEEINVYKSVRKQAIKSELIKEEEQRLNLIIQKNKLQNELKKISQELSLSKAEILQKNNEILSLNQKLNETKTQTNLKNIEISRLSKVIEDLKMTQRQKSNNKVQGRKQEQIPEWVRNFLNVFKNMLGKLPIDVDPKWSEKKMIIIGWKVVKLIIEKAIKIGIKVPRIINDDAKAQCSIIQYPDDPSRSLKRYSMIDSKENKKK